MTPRQKRNLSLAKQRRIEKAQAAYVKAYTELVRVYQASQCVLVSDAHVPEWFGQPPRGVTVQ